MDSDADLGQHVTIGAYSVIESNVTIGDRTEIGNHVNLSSGTKIGTDCKIFHSASMSNSARFKIQ